MDLLLADKYVVERDPLKECTFRRVRFHKDSSFFLNLYFVRVPLEKMHKVLMDSLDQYGYSHMTHTHWLQLFPMFFRSLMNARCLHRYRFLQHTAYWNRVDPLLDLEPMEMVQCDIATY